VGFIELHVGDTRVVFTDRHGGVSEPPYDTANLGLLTDDDPDRVAENRRRVAAELGGSLADPQAWFRIRQVHGATVAVADDHAGGAPDADAALTTATGRPLMVLTADCAPVALVGAGAVAAVHAGWRGLRDGVVESAAAALRDRAPGTVRAVLGPCIHADRYEFGATELDALAAQLGPEVRSRPAAGGPAFDLPAGVRAALVRAGVTDVVDVDVCTAASPDYFSHRRDGDTGRQALLVVREP
jgi:hypothetical protein